MYSILMRMADTTLGMEDRSQPSGVNSEFRNVNIGFELAANAGWYSKRDFGLFSPGEGLHKQQILGKKNVPKSMRMHL